MIVKLQMIYFNTEKQNYSLLMIVKLQMNFSNTEKQNYNNDCKVTNEVFLHRKT